MKKEIIKIGKAFCIVWIGIMLVTPIVMLLHDYRAHNRMDQLQQNQSDDHALLHSKVMNIAELEIRVNKWKKDFYLKERED